MIHFTAKIFPEAVIIGKEKLSMGPESRIDGFTFINTGKYVKLGRNVHIHHFCEIIGGGEFIAEDFASIAARVSMLTGSDDFRGPYLINSTVPPEYTNVNISYLKLERHCVIGTGTIIFPGTTIPEGASIAAGCMVRPCTKLIPWGIYAGQNPRRVGMRDKNKILALAHEYLKHAPQ